MIVVDMGVFHVFNMSDHIKTWELVVDDTMDGEDNLEVKTREDADVRMY